MESQKSTSGIGNRPPPTEEQIRTLAYVLWEKDGGPDGRSEEYWEKAREQLLAEDAPGQPPRGGAST